MDNKALKGIALILFGILLCVGSAEINSTLLQTADKAGFLSNRKSAFFYLKDKVQEF